MRCAMGRVGGLKFGSQLLSRQERRIEIVCYPSLSGAVSQHGKCRDPRIHFPDLEFKSPTPGAVQHFPKSLLMRPPVGTGERFMRPLAGRSDFLEKSISESTLGFNSR